MSWLVRRYLYRLELGSSYRTRPTVESPQPQFPPPRILIGADSWNLIMGDREKSPLRDYSTADFGPLSSSTAEGLYAICWSKCQVLGHGCAGIRAPQDPNPSAYANFDPHVNLDNVLCGIGPLVDAALKAKGIKT